MEVTKENFSDAFLEVQAAIHDCDFLAIDTELTGLQATKEERIRFLDTQVEYYLKRRESARKFAVTQYGICTFQWDAKNKSYKAKPFCFAIFPRHAQNNWKTFLVQPNSFSFLADNKFDFNKWVYNGISYLSKDDEEKIRKEGLGAFSPMKAREDVVIINEKDRVFVQEICTRVDEWKKSQPKPPLVIEKCNAFQRKLIYQEIPKRYEDLHVEGIMKDNFRMLKISIVTEEERKKKAEEAKIAAENELKESLGFRRVIDLISQSKKPVIGHNCFLDFLQTFEKFRGMLPGTSDGFKLAFTKLFPTILDTKFLSTQNADLKSHIPLTGLSDLYSTVNQEPFTYPKVKYATNFEKYQSGDAFHDAGFDAYCTGFAFLRMAYYLTMKESSSHKEKVNLDHGVITSFYNKLYMMNSDCFYNLDGPDVVPDRLNVFYVSGFERSTTENDIMSHFAPIGNTRIHWIDDVSCFVSILDAENEKLVFNSVMEIRGPFQVAPYSSYFSSRAAENGRGEESEEPKKRPRANASQEMPIRKKQREGEEFISYDCTIS